MRVPQLTRGLADSSTLHIKADLLIKNELVDSLARLVLSM
jgi:hypothetical protein